jgi:hypothetical protein
MRRVMVLVTVELLMMAMLAASVGVAQGLASTPTVVKVERTPSGVPVEPAACEWAAGTAGLEWRAGGVCWLELPGWDAAF